MEERSGPLIHQLAPLMTIGGVGPSFCKDAGRLRVLAHWLKGWQARTQFPSINPLGVFGKWSEFCTESLWLQD